MEAAQLVRLNDITWRFGPTGAMRVPGVIFADPDLIGAMDDKVLEQVANVASLPGIVRACFAMPDAHWGYGFPIGGVAAFDPEAGGVVSAGGVGFDISCGVRMMLSDLTKSDVAPVQNALADALFATIPAGVGSQGKIRLDDNEMTAMLEGGARWAVSRGYGLESDLLRIEESGCMAGANPQAVSARARRRQRDEMGTLGSGNHYLEVQEVGEIFDQETAKAFGLSSGQIVVSIHCGSRGLGHQIGTEFLKEMAIAAEGQGIRLPDRELACARIDSPLGERYLGAMRAAINCALANRQIIGQLTRQVFDALFPGKGLRLLYDVSHNTCKLEAHAVDGKTQNLYVHRKGATRALGPGHPLLPTDLRGVGQPVLIGGSMGTGSYVLVGTVESEARSFSSACHGAGRRMSRHKAVKQWKGRQVIDALAKEGILVRSPSFRGVAEEAPGAYKDVDAVVAAADQAGLARRVAKLRPLVCVKG